MTLRIEQNVYFIITLMCYKNEINRKPVQIIVMIIKKFAVIAIFLLAGAVSFAQNKTVSCHQGNQKEHTITPCEMYSAGAEIVGQFSYDPNEIVGPQGYDSLRWVSINDVLNYTILFENDPEFATANAQKVDVRFDFGQKELMKDFTLGTFGFVFFL